MSLNQYWDIRIRRTKIRYVYNMQSHSPFRYILVVVLGGIVVSKVQYLFVSYTR